MTVRSDVNIDQLHADECDVARAFGDPQPNRGATEAYIISMMLMWNYCERFGHAFEDAGSYANGESAEERMCCKRCGYSWSHIYY